MCRCLYFEAKAQHPFGAERFLRAGVLADLFAVFFIFLDPFAHMFIGRFAHGADGRRGKPVAEECGFGGAAEGKIDDEHERRRKAYRGGRQNQGALFHIRSMCVNFGFMPRKRLRFPR